MHFKKITAVQCSDFLFFGFYEKIFQNFKKLLYCLNFQSFHFCLWLSTIIIYVVIYLSFTNLNIYLNLISYAQFPDELLILPPVIQEYVLLNTLANHLANKRRGPPTDTQQEGLGSIYECNEPWTISFSEFVGAYKSPST